LQRGYLPILSWTQRRPVITLGLGVSPYLVMTFGAAGSVEDRLHRLERCERLS
jgi:hypothetical protein